MNHWRRTIYKHISQRFKDIMKQIIKRDSMYPYKNIHCISIEIYSSDDNFIKTDKMLKITSIL